MSMKNDPLKYKTVRQLLISDLETRRKWRENTCTSPSSTHQQN